MPDEYPHLPPYGRLRLEIFRGYRLATYCTKCRRHGKKIEVRKTPAGHRCLNCWLKEACDICGVRAPVDTLRGLHLCERCLCPEATRRELFDEILSRPVDYHPLMRYSTA